MTVGQTCALPILTKLGLAQSINLFSRERAANTISTYPSAKEYVSSERSRMGAYQNRLEHTINNLNNVAEQTTAAESRIRSADMAREAMTLARENILLQANQAIIVQANQSYKTVLELLQE